MSGLAELLARVREATGPDRGLETAIVLQFYDYKESKIHSIHDLAMHRYTASIDAALALVERMFGLESPSMLYSYDLNWHASAHAHMAYVAGLHIAVGDPPTMHTFHGQAHTQPLAILAALLTALSSIEGEGK